MRGAPYRVARMRQRRGDSAACGGHAAIVREVRDDRFSENPLALFFFLFSSLFFSVVSVKQLIEALKLFQTL